MITALVALVAAPVGTANAGGPFKSVVSVGYNDPNIPDCTMIDSPPNCEHVVKMAQPNGGGTVSCPCPWEVWGGEERGCIKP